MLYCCYLLWCSGVNDSDDDDVVNILLFCQVLLLLGEEAEASPSIANTLWRVWTMFTRSAITLPEVNGFGWNLGNSEYIVWSCPWQILGAIRPEAVAGARAEIFFCPLNNARFHRLLSAKFHEICTKRRVSVSSVGALEHLWKFARKGYFFQKKPQFWLHRSRRFPTSAIDFSETITNLGKSWQVGTPVECWLSIDTVGMNSKWFPWHVTPAHGDCWP